MVDLNGMIMWPTSVNQFGDPNIAAKKSVGHYLSVANAGTGVAGGGDFYPNTGGVNYNATAAAVSFLAIGTAKSPATGVVPPYAASN